MDEREMMLLELCLTVIAATAFAFYMGRESVYRELDWELERMTRLRPPARIGGEPGQPPLGKTPADDKAEL
jgi:hypothetical protein